MRIGRMRKHLLVAATAAVLTGCAAGANPGAMTASVSEQTLLPAGSVLRRAVELGTVSGGRDTNPLWTSQVSDSDFATALRQSLTTHTMLALGGQSFRLDATLIELDQPLAGFDLTVQSRVRYRLTRLADGATVFDREVNARYTAAFSSSFYAVERLRLANEGAIKENISQFLAALVAEDRANPSAFRQGGARIS
jgi:hypothetical protein